MKPRFLPNDQFGPSAVSLRKALSLSPIEKFLIDQLNVSLMYLFIYLFILFILFSFILRSCLMVIFCLLVCFLFYSEFSLFWISVCLKSHEPPLLSIKLESHFPTILLLSSSALYCQFHIITDLFIFLRWTTDTVQ